MSLIKCDECGHEVSDRALFCPHCGFPVHLNASHPTGVAPAAYSELEAKILSEKPAPASEPATAPEPEPATADESAAAAFEADLEARRRRNDKAKMWVFLSAFLLVFAIVIYFFVTAPDDAAGEAADADFVEEVITAPADSTATADSVAADSVPAEVTPTVKAVKLQQPVRRQSVADANETPGGDVRQVTVKSLREQAADPVTPTQTPAPASQPSPAEPE